jgi:hypothetical protein
MKSLRVHAMLAAICAAVSVGISGAAAQQPFYKGKTDGSYQRVGIGQLPTYIVADGLKKRRADSTLRGQHRPNDTNNL